MRESGAPARVKRLYRRYALAATSVAAVGLLLAGLRPHQDLTRAIDGGVGRAIAPAVSPAPFGWVDLAAAAPGNDSLLHRPVALCWLGKELAVADATRGRVTIFDSSGVPRRSFGSFGLRPEQFVRLEAMSCAPSGRAILTADPETRRVSIFTPDGKYLGGAPAPPTPQALPFLGAFALADDGTFYDSWLGSTINVGPYLAENAAWDSVRLVRRWSPTGILRASVGVPTRYRDPVARRVFNRVFMALHRDTLWVMTQADGQIRRYDSLGREGRDRVFLPLYHRGAEPIISVGRDDGSGFRHSKLAYQPNVRGLAVVYDSLFAYARYQHWRFVHRGGWSTGFFDYWPETSVEVADRRGKVLASFAAPGLVRTVASDGGRRAAILVEESDQHLRVLVGTLPQVVAPLGPVPLGTAGRQLQTPTTRDVRRPVHIRIDTGDTE